MESSSSLSHSRIRKAKKTSSSKSKPKGEKKKKTELESWLKPIKKGRKKKLAKSLTSSFGSTLDSFFRSKGPRNRSILVNSSIKKNKKKSSPKNRRTAKTLSELFKSTNSMKNSSVKASKVSSRKTKELKMLALLKKLIKK